ncbi:MAG: DUF1638 domain-containing protein [Candidatus Marinimicrobia bacterium]|jgi:hypothetical protein|nr:DUF1638 domain-containing protein [Candidatus Neomarinimicrobiota bacterium]MDP6611545.1 DUF1638 domain-containing protein [Candidatus Neomarinimicrobiota bacterium]|tara:strand:+ start:807 stop:1553 length:747 start_codon:yes stop_codon:yes gene_type:complete
MNFKLISCEVFKHEFFHCINKTNNNIDAEFIAKGIHDLNSKGMQNRIVKCIQKADQKKFDAILLGYGLCNSWIYGLSARKTPLVIPRNHDCIGILLGSKQKYLDYYFENTGTYFQSIGWVKNTENEPSIKKRSLQKLYGMDMSQDELIAQYGEENLGYLNGALDQTKHYSNMAFIDTGMDSDYHFQNHAKSKAEKNKWTFDVLKGNTNLLQNLVNGNWSDSEFIFVNPGAVVQQSIDEDLVTVTTPKS